MKRKLTIVLLTIAIVAASAAGGFWYLSQSKGDKPPQSTVTSDGIDAPPGGILYRPSTQGLTPPTTGPIGTWDIDIPKINPLGSQSLYSSTQQDTGYSTVTFIDYYQERTRTVYGDRWGLRVEDNSGIEMEWLRQYAESIDATIYDTPLQDQLVFQLQASESEIWWASAKSQSDGYWLEVIKETRLLANAKQTLDLSSLNQGDETIDFTTYNDGTHFQSMTITIPKEDEIRLTARYDSTDGALTTSFHYSKLLSGYKSTIHVLDDIPQIAGVMHWTITKEGDSKASQATILLEEPYVLPPVKTGEDFGFIRVVNATGAVSLHTATYASYYQNDTGIDINSYQTLQGDMTADGDYLLSVPAGHHTIAIEGNPYGLEYALVRLIPVSANEITTVVIPQSFQSAMAAIDLVAPSDNVDSLLGGIDILEAMEKKNTGELQIVVNDPQNRDITLSKENVAIKEGGMPTKIVSIERKISPSSIVLVLDSSGSMSKQMSATLDAAKTFIEQLPDNTFIQIIDFDSKVAVLSGTSKAQAIKDLTSIKAEGSTKLYDAIIKGLEIVKQDNKTRPALVVFADGADSREDKTGKSGQGSNASKQEALNAIKSADVKVFAIGFGEGHDPAPLKAFSSLTGGAYYNAKDTNALTSIFASINSQLGNSFVITYERPKVSSLSDNPMISLVVDNSGSMDTDPSECQANECGYRIEQVRSLFHDFVREIPDQYLVNAITFTEVFGNSLIRLQQMATTSKPALLQAMGDMEGIGGTPIFLSTKIAYEAIRSVPTSKKIIVYLTDAALAVEEDEQELFDAVLDEIKKAGIHVIWMGLGVEGSEQAFARAAQRSGGSYVIASDAKGLQSALNNALASAKLPSSTTSIPLSISIQDKDDNGSVIHFTAATDVEFTPPKTGESLSPPDGVEIKTGEKINRYNKKTSTLLYGSDISNKETAIRLQMAIHAAKENNQMKLTVNDLYALDSFKGMRSDQLQFIALDVKLTNTAKTPYHIPSFQNHFYLNVNESGSRPAHASTWLANMPLVNPGEYDIQLSPGESKEGVLVFVVPQDALSTVSLSFFDLEHGHIAMPLVGSLTPDSLQLNALPQNTTKITDAFSISLTSQALQPNIQKLQAEEQTAFQILEAEFSTKVQVLLDIDPAKRLLYQIETANGPLIYPLHDATTYLPLGFHEPVVLGPNSKNRIRLAFQVPEKMASAKSSLICDIQDGSLRIPVNAGSAYGTQTNGVVAAGEHADMKINYAVKMKPESAAGHVVNYGRSDVIVDLTVLEKKDGYGLSGFDSNAFYLVRDDHDTNAENNEMVYHAGLGVLSGRSTQDTIVYSTETMNYLHGIDSSFVVFDGMQRRGILHFLLPEISEHNWYLQSPYFPKMRVKITDDGYPYPELLTKKTDVEVISSFDNELLDELVKAAVVKYELSKSEAGSVSTTKRIGLGANENETNEIIAPSLSIYGASKLREIETYQQMVSLMSSLTAIMDKGSYRYNYAPEAIITQGWGSQWDLANMAQGLLHKIGYQTKLRQLALSDQGRAALSAMTKMNIPDDMSIPGLMYVNENGDARIFVIPFMKDISQLHNQVYLRSTTNPHYSQEHTLLPNTATISVTLRAKLLKTDQAAITGDIAAILGGEEGSDGFTDEINLMHVELPLDKLSLDAIDIGYAKTGQSDKGNLYLGAMNTPNGLITGDTVLDTASYEPLTLHIEVTTNGATSTHIVSIPKGCALEDVYHSIGINLPDLTQDSAKVLQESADARYQAADRPNNSSGLRWYTRGALASFIHYQTAYEKRYQDVVNVVMGRIYQPRIIAVDAFVRDSSVTTQIDLMSIHNDLHTEDTELIRSYHIAAGLFASELEGRVLPDGTTNFDYLTLWSKTKDLELVYLVGGDMGSTFVSMNEDVKLPYALVDHLQNTSNMFLVPMAPVLVDGVERWAWLEIDADTYQTISYLDNGGRSSMAEYVMNMMPDKSDMDQYIVGAMIGASCSIWAVSTFSLTLDDYGDILANAYALMGMVADQVDTLMNHLGNVEKLTEITDIDELKEFVADQVPGIMEVKGQAGKVHVSYKIDWQGRGSLSSGHDFNLAQGFRDGITMYFSNSFP